MNQILLTNNSNNYNKRNRGNSGNTDNIRKIIIFFSIAILIFALLIVGVYAYKTYKNNNQSGQVAGKPEVSLEEIEGQVRITAKSQTGISKLIYTWNNEEQMEIPMNGRTSYEETIDVLVGNNTLNVKVIDVNNQETETSQNFKREISDKPVIETEIGQDARLRITATSNIEMAYITYKWNEEEEITVRAENETDKIIETVIDVKRGENILTVTAVNLQGSTETISKKFNGVNKPIIEVTKRGGRLDMIMTHDKGFEKIEFYLNGQIFNYDENLPGYDPTRQEIGYAFNLQEGENIIIIVATSTEGTQSIYQGKCNYPTEE